jgi:hypothetical protein
MRITETVFIRATILLGEADVRRLDRCRSNDVVERLGRRKQYEDDLDSCIGFDADSGTRFGRSDPTAV